MRLNPGYACYTTIIGTSTFLLNLKAWLDSDVRLTIEAFARQKYGPASAASGRTIFPICTRGTFTSGVYGSQRDRPYLRKIPRLRRRRNPRGIRQIARFSRPIFNGRT
jgi:hypothetical protein